MRSMKIKLGVGCFQKERQNKRTGQGLGQEERDIGDVMPRFDISWLQTPVALDDMNTGKRTVFRIIDLSTDPWESNQVSRRHLWF